MDMDFSPEDLAFQAEVRAFLDDKLNARLREGAAATPHGQLFFSPSSWPPPAMAARSRCGRMIARGLKDTSRPRAVHNRAMVVLWKPRAIT